MKKFLNALCPALLVALYASGAMAAAGTSTINTLFSTVETTLYSVSAVVVTISVMWAGYKVLFMGNTMMEVAKPLMGGIMIGAASWIAGLLVG